MVSTRNTEGELVKVTKENMMLDDGTKEIGYFVSLSMIRNISEAWTSGIIKDEQAMKMVTRTIKGVKW